jgi:hypothetical protein
MRITSWCRWATAVVPLMLLLTPGCQKDPSPLATVTGKVTYRGLSLQGGTVVFAPDTSRGQRGDMAVGTIGPDGRYSLNTGEVSGVSPGFYRVTVAAIVAPNPAGDGQRFSVPQSLLPEKYRDPELSLLACEVKAGKANTINFDLD